MDFEQPGLFSRADALRAGFTDDDLRRARAHGELQTIRRGYYVRTGVLQTLDSHARHRMLAHAIYSESSTRAVFSHVTAAVMHRMETWDIPLDKVTLTIGRSYAGKRGRLRVLHGLPVPDADLVEIDGFPVTTPSRTVADLARSLPLIPSVCIGDHALRTGIATLDDLHRAVEGARNRTGIAKARQAIALMSDRSGCVGESRSRLQLGTLPLPPPLLNRAVYDESGLFVHTAHFLYPDHGVIGHFKSHGPYDPRPPLPHSETARNEDRLNRLGWVLVQWDWLDLDDAKELTERIARAMVHAGARRAPLGSFQR